MLTLVASSLLSLLPLSGSTLCPTPEQVAALLPAPQAGAQLNVVLEDHLDEVTLSLAGPAGRRLASRALSRLGTCDELAALSAQIITVWASEFGQTTGRFPLRARGGWPEPRLPAPLTLGEVEERAGDRYHLELGASAGAALTPRSSGALAAVEVSALRPHRPSLHAMLSVRGPMRFDDVERRFDGAAVQTALALGPGFRLGSAPLVLDLFTLLPLSVLVPLTSRTTAPLPGSPPWATLVLEAETGARVTVWSGPLAFTLRAAVSVRLLSSPGVDVAPVSLSLMAGLSRLP